MNDSRYYRHFNLLFSPDLLQRIAEHSQKFCTDKDFPVGKGLSVRDEAQRAFRITRAAWQDARALHSPEAQQSFINTILCEVLGYDTPYTCPEHGIVPDAPVSASLFPEEVSEEEDSRPRYPVSLLLKCGTWRYMLPIIVVPSNIGLDAKYSFTTGHRLSPTQMMQTYLNASQEYSWAIVTNGSNWRLLRDNPALSRPCYLDVDLDLILQEGDSSAFDSIFWRLLHASRAKWQDEEKGSATCLWERWRQDLEEHGARARDGLREGVEEAICRLGTGFLRGEGSGNDALRRALASGEVSAQDIYRQLLRLAYRLIFLSVLEGRKLLHAHREAEEKNTAIYADGYSLARLIPRAMYRDQEDSRHDDLWQAQLIVFRGLGMDGGLPQLSLPALGGLFAPDQCRHLDCCRLPNSAFLSALHFLRWTSTDNKRTLIDYINMDAEELGSVYESLLELAPRISTERQLFYFSGGASDPTTSAKKQKGNARKTTGSYYTPSCLVEQTLKTALDPLLDDCCKNPVHANSRILALRVIDPACGSGHFLLAAARRMAERLAAVRTQGQTGGYTPRVFRLAMHDIIRHCIYGVDINPMAVELVRMNLWLEGYLPGKALSFLDDHLRCGNSLLGIFDAEALPGFIPADAFKCNPGDDKAVCKSLAALNRKQIKNTAKSAELLWSWKAEQQVDQICSEDQPSQVQHQARDWQTWQKKRHNSQQAIAADIWLGTFLLPKTQQDLVPTTATWEAFRAGIYSADMASIRAARQACHEAQVFHWFLEFPEIFDNGGFDCVLGNPPWERMKIQEKEWFASRCPQIAECAKTDKRRKLIALLQNGELPDMDPAQQRTLYARYQNALRVTAVTSLFAHLDGGRFPLTGTGDVNMFALFAETAYKLRSPEGRAGIIVPTNLATDDSTSTFFKHLVHGQHVQAIYDFENREKLFPAVDCRQRFCVLTLAPASTIDLACYMAHPRQLEDEERHAYLQAEDFSRINPNSGTCPLFRCKADAELAVKIYHSVPILCNEKTGENPWGISFGTMLHMSNDSALFHETPSADALPLYEGKLIHQYDHRFNIFETTGANAKGEEVPVEDKRNITYEIRPRYWVCRADVIAKLPNCCQELPQLFIGFRKITNATNERTLILSFLPFAGVGDSLPLIFSDLPVRQQCALVGNANSLVMDYIVRQKLGGLNMNFFYFKQFPFLPPSAYSDEDIAYISTRVLELSYTSWSMAPLAEALGYSGAPFVWDDDRRAQLKAELDAYYAKLYGLTRDELAYILDPTTKYPHNCPTVTFPGLKSKELKKYGEYCTQRLVLAAYDAPTQAGK